MSRARITLVAGGLAGLLFLVLLHPGDSAQESSERDLIRDLLHQLRDLSVERAEFDKEKEELGRTELQLIEENKELKAERTIIQGEEELVRRDEVQLDGERSEYQRQADEHDKYCIARVTPEERDRRLPWCRQNVLRLMKWKKQLDLREATLRNLRESLLKRGERLRERQEAHNRATLHWASQQKEFNAKDGDWEGRWEALRRFLLSPDLEDLKQRAHAGVVCAQLTRLEEAHNCLQRIWVWLR